MIFFRVQLLVLILGLGFISTIHAETSAPAILVFGDSLSTAYGIPVEQGWVALLQKRLQDKQFPQAIVNASLSGETTSGGLSRFAAALKQHQPSYVLLALGGNDGLRGLSLKQMRSNLSKIITLAQQNHTQVILFGMMIPPNYGPRYTLDFKSIYPQLADEFKLKLVPFFLDGIAGKPEYIQSDGLHPNAHAQIKILDNVWPVLEKTLSRN